MGLHVRRGRQCPTTQASDFSVKTHSSQLLRVVLHEQQQTCKTSMCMCMYQYVRAAQGANLEPTHMIPSRSPTLTRSSWNRSTVAGSNPPYWEHSSMFFYTHDCSRRVCRKCPSIVLAYLLKMPANFVPHYLMIQASSELTRPGTCLVYSWKDLPAGFYRLNVTMTRDRNFSAEKVPF